MSVSFTGVLLSAIGDVEDLFDTVLGFVRDFEADVLVVEILLVEFVVFCRLVADCFVFELLTLGLVTVVVFTVGVSGGLRENCDFVNALSIRPSKFSVLVRGLVPGVYVVGVLSPSTLTLGFEMAKLSLHATDFALPVLFPKGSSVDFLKIGRDVEPFGLLKARSETESTSEEIFGLFTTFAIGVVG